MKASKVIIKLQSLIKKHGDLECFDANQQSLIIREVEPDIDEYPEDWNMPKQFFEFGELP